ncbi:hypothetical protein KIN20_011647 [Parelaphostrongylus tenuis]|uniref:Uncharacterized protein n=1 Tax=Parelaphostrongylus tenuis TaxID=148309 RepID=A0AAD5QMM1_PARTN|nr:hypothetical protein KIN20_011647 [Parelaphostrongylus tenuis]
MSIKQNLTSVMTYDDSEFPKTSSIEDSTSITGQGGQVFCTFKIPSVENLFVMIVEQQTNFFRGQFPSGLCRRTALRMKLVRSAIDTDLCHRDAVHVHRLVAVLPSAPAFSTLVRN